MTEPASNARIVITEDTLKVGQTDSLPELEDGMASGLRKLEADFEATAFEPVRIDPGPPPVMLTLGDLREHDTAQNNALQRIDDIFRQAGEDQDGISTDLRGDIVHARKLAIKTEALEKVRQFSGPMADRAKIAEATKSFYRRSAVLRRARFDKSDPVNSAITAAWVARLSAASPLSLAGFARDAAASQNPALAALVIENTHGRGANVSDAVRHEVEAVTATLKLTEADEGLRLVRSIIDANSMAESAIRVFMTGRPDALGSITKGLRARGD